MNSSIVEEALKLLKDEADFSAKSKLHLAYEKFNQQESCKSNKCEKVENPKNPETQFNKEIVNLCCKVENILKILDTSCLENDEFANKNCCDYLLYWLYGEIIKGKYNAFSIHWLYDKIQTLLEENNSSSDRKVKCNESFMRIFDMEKLTNKKILFDFLSYYDSVYSILTTGESKNKKEYCQYLDFIFYIYSKIHEGYHSKTIKAYDNEINGFQEKLKSNHYNILKSKCLDLSQKSILKHLNAFIHTLNVQQTEYSKLISEPFNYGNFINVSNDIPKIRKNYDIFRYIHSYEAKEILARSNTDDMPDHTHYCSKINEQHASDYEGLKNTCKKFVLYFTYLSQNIPIDVNYFEYLNYWLNKELKETSTSATDFIRVMDSILNYEFPVYSLYYKFKDKVYNIKEDVFNEMDTLYTLYDNYNKFLTETENENKCEEYVNTCLSVYTENVNNCYQNKNRHFYKALLQFRDIYNKKKTSSKKCITQQLQNLPEAKTFEQHKKEIYKKKASSSCKNIESKSLKLLPNGKHDYENILKDLSAHDVYKKLDEYTPDEITCTNYCKEVISLDDKKEEVILLCAKIVKNLKELPTILTSVTSQDDLCSYLLYWSYEKIMNIFNNDPTKYNDYSVLNKLNYVLLNVNKDLEANKRCSYNFDGIFSEWEKEKDLHDYFKNFDKINECITDSTVDCKTYCNYLNHINNLYMNYIGNCCTCYTKPPSHCTKACPRYFKCNKKYFPSDLMSTFKCDNIVSTKSADQIFKNLTIDRDAIEKTNAHFGNIFTELMRDPFNVIMLPSFASLGISSVFFLFYKFTPLGSLLHRRSNKNKRIRDSLEKGHTPKSSRNKAKPKSVNPQNKRIRIAYSQIN
ncbi:PIR protein [Plasmodium vivax]|uniref:VIR protein n=1 Tax=Plasmodium vivax TaxID=5855 RepID=A0A565A7A2_PLAVI|nr:PIR protein [Plasmodium vivax]